MFSKLFQFKTFYHEIGAFLCRIWYVCQFHVAAFFCKWISPNCASWMEITNWNLTPINKRQYNDPITYGTYVHTWLRTKSKARIVNVLKENQINCRFAAVTFYCIRSPSNAVEIFYELPQSWHSLYSEEFNQRWGF